MFLKVVPSSGWTWLSHDLRGGASVCPGKLVLLPGLTRSAFLVAVPEDFASYPSSEFTSSPWGWGREQQHFPYPSTSPQHRFWVSQLRGIVSASVVNGSEWGYQRPPHPELLGGSKEIQCVKVLWSVESSKNNDYQQHYHGTVSYSHWFIGCLACVIQEWCRPYSLVVCISLVYFYCYYWLN